MLTLGIETSCDETAIAIVENGWRVLSSRVSSQIKIHETFGGVVPEIAAREHLNQISHLYQQCLHEAGIQDNAIDLVSVTQGPGLAGALLVGASFAKGLAFSLDVPLIPINHIHGHVFGAFLNLEKLDWREILPALVLVVSGGHTNFYSIERLEHWELLGFSLDDACGECFDKIAKFLNLPYPGGPFIEKNSIGGNPQAIPMPQLKWNPHELRFSYSGLKTHMVYTITKQPDLRHGQGLKDLCASFQDAAFRQLIGAIKIGLKQKPMTQSVVIAGGVSANQTFRDHLATLGSIKIWSPQKQYCADNAAMIASCGYYKYHCSHSREIYKKPFPWDIFTRYPFEKVEVDL